DHLHGFASEGNHGLRPAHPLPDGEVPFHLGEDCAEDWRDYCAQIRAPVARSARLGPEKGLADSKTAIDSLCCHPNVNGGTRNVAVPDILREAALDQLGRQTKIGPDRVANPLPIERSHDRIDDAVSDRAIEF